MQDRIILGIDPGSNITGFALIRIKKSAPELMRAGVMDVSSCTDHFTRLQKIFSSLLQLIDDYQPQELAVEEPFYGKNVQSMLKLGRAQGVAIAAALHRNVLVTGYSPRKIKQSITGKGSASKEQVAEMLKRILHYDHELEYLDASDALAVAVCHYFQGNASVPGKQFSGWKSFLQANPERIS
jgi:crossover junction endodeoxyribonuclease RuvC